MFYHSILHPKQFKYLGAFYLHSLIRLFAISIFQIFSSIYIYQALLNFGIQKQQSLAVTAIFFGLVYLVHAISVAPVLWLISKKGLRFSVFWGNVILICFFAFLYLSKFDPIFLIITAVLGGLQIGLYWIAYHIYLVELSEDENQGEEIALGGALSAVASIGGPAFGGLLIFYFGFGAVFLIMTVIIIFAIYPLRYLPNKKNTISIDIFKVASALAPQKEFKSFLALLGAGVVDFVGGNFWPIFIFPVVAGYAGVGFIGSLIALISTVTTLAIGALIDKFGARSVMNILSPLDSINWVFRIFVETPFRAFATSAVQAVTTSGQILALDTTIYERARHNDIAAFIVQREMGLSLGRFSFLFIIGVLLWFGLPLKAVFIVTAIAALFTRFYPVGVISKSEIKG